MKKLFFALTTLILLLTNAAFADDSKDTSSKEVNYCPIKPETNPSDEINGRGCCSHHGGVCGCAGYRAQCCDGTTSPSCGC